MEKLVHRELCQGKRTKYKDQQGEREEMDLLEAALQLSFESHSH